MDDYKVIDINFEQPATNGQVLSFYAKIKERDPGFYAHIGEGSPANPPGGLDMVLNNQGLKGRWRSPIINAKEICEILIALGISIESIFFSPMRCAWVESCFCHTIPDKDYGCSGAAHSYFGEK